MSAGARPTGSGEGPRPAPSRPPLRPFIREGPHGPPTPRDEATATTSGAILRPRRTDPWCSGPTCQPVTLEIAGSNPVGSAIHPASPYAPSARPDGASLFSCLRLTAVASGRRWVRGRCARATTGLARFARARRAPRHGASLRPPAARPFGLASFAAVKRLPLVTVLALLAVTVAISVGLGRRIAAAPRRRRAAAESPSSRAASPRAGRPRPRRRPQPRRRPSAPTATTAAARRRPDRAGDPVPDDRRADHERGGRGRRSPGRARPTTRSSSSTRTPTRSSPRSAPSGRPPATAPRPRTGRRRRSRRTSPRTASTSRSCAPDEVGPAFAPWAGATRRSSATAA